MTDPTISTAELAEAIGLPVHTLRLWLRAGNVQRAVRGVHFISALQATLSAIRAETANARAYQAPALPPAPKRDDTGLASIERTVARDLARIRPSHDRHVSEAGRIEVQRELDRLIARLPRLRTAAEKVRA